MPRRRKTMMNGAALAAKQMLTEHMEMVDILTRIVDEGSYDDDGDFYLLHRKGAKPEDDYLDPQPITDAIELLKRVTRFKL